MPLDNFEIDVSTTDNIITITIVSNETILDEKITVFSLQNTEEQNVDIDFQVVDKFVKEFNRVSQNAIVDYNFELKDKKSVSVCVLLKQFFSKFGEKQRYLCYKATYNEEEKSVTLTRTKQKLDVKCPSSSESSPFNQIVLKNDKTPDGLNKTTVVVTADTIIDDYTNFDLIMTFTKKMLYENYNNLENYIKLSN